MADTPRIPIEFTFEDKQFKEMAAQMDKLYNDAKKFSDILKGGAGTAETKQNLKGTVTEMDRLNKQMAKYEQQAQSSVGIIQKMENEVKKLKIQQKLATNPDDVKRYQKEMVKLRKDIAKAKDTTRGWGKALDSFQFKFNALGNIAANFSSSIARGITGALRNAVKVTIEFEKTFAAVLTLMSEAEKKRFGDVLKQNSIDLMTKYGLSIEEVNKATFDAVSAGIKMGDMFQFMDAAAKLAVGGVTDLASSVKGLASIINAFNLESSEATNVAATLFQAQRFGITYIDEMVASVGRLNTIAAMTSTSYQEMAAAFAAVTKSGLNTEESVTGLRNVFKTLASPAKEAQIAIAKYNKAIEGLDIVYGTAALRQKGFLGELDELQKLYEAQPDALTEIFGNIRGLTGATGLLGDNYERFREIMLRVNDAQESQQSLNAAVEEQMGTMAKKVDIIRAKWEVFILALSSGKGVFGSVFQFLIDRANDLVDAFTPLNLEIQNIKTAMQSGADSGRAFFEGIEQSASVVNKKGKERIDILNSIVNAEIKAAKDERDALQNKIELYNKYGTTSDALIKQIESNYERTGEWLKVENDERDEYLQNERKRQLAYKNSYIQNLSEQILANEQALSQIVVDDEDAAKKQLELDKLRLKNKYEYEKSILNLYGDGYKAQLALAERWYNYEKDLIELTIKDEEQKNILLLTLENEYTKKRRDLLDKKIEAEQKSAEKAKDAWLEVFDLEDEEYIDDIPIDLDAMYETLKKRPESLGDLLGLDDETQEALNAAINGVEYFTEMWVEAADRRIDAVQREIDASDERLRSLQADRDHEWERMQQGYANNYALKQREIEDEKARQAELRKEEKKALQAKKRATDAEIAINTILELSNLTLAAAQIIQSESKTKGIAGLAIGLAGAAVLLGAFMAFKANAKDAVTGYAEGVIDLDGEGTETSDSIPARLSRGESVMTAKTTKRNKKTLSFMQKNPNHPLFNMMEKEGVNSVFNKLSYQMSDGWASFNTRESKWDEKMYEELKGIRTKNDEMSNRPYSFTKGGYIYTIEGNQVTRTKIG